MIWTKRHSKNAVAAKARKRLTRATAPIQPEPRRYIPHPRSKAAVRIQIRDMVRGDSITLNLHKMQWPNQWHCKQGQFSTAHIAKAIKLMLQSISEQ